MMWLNSKIKTGIKEFKSPTIETINALSIPLQVIRSVGDNLHDGRDGLAKDTKARIDTIYCIIRPFSKSSEGLVTRNELRGITSSATFILHYNPYHPKHDHPIHLQTADKYNNSDYIGFADQIIYDNDEYSIKSIYKISNESLENGFDNQDQYIGRCLIQKSHVRNHLFSKNNTGDMYELT